MKCDACGGPIVDGKCTYCGKEFPQITPETANRQAAQTDSKPEPEPRVVEKEKIVYVDRPVVQSEPKKKEKKHGCCGTILWGIIILGVIGFVFYNFGGGKAKLQSARSTSSTTQTAKNSGTASSAASTSTSNGTTSSSTANTSVSSSTSSTANTNASKDTASSTIPDTSASSSSSGSSSSSANGVDPQFKATMDSYEEFFDEYCDFMESYDANDATMLLKYATMMSKYAEMIEKLDDIDESQLSAADDAYYIEVQSRINTRLAQVSVDQ